MDSGYGYNNSFGGGGGFMPGEMSTSPAGGRSDVNNQTIRPITIKQAVDASQPYPEANYQIDGADTANIVLVGQVRNISTQTTNITYKIDDGTEEIEVKQWVDSATVDNMDTDERGLARGKDQITVTGYVKVFGKLKAFSNKKFVGAHEIRPLTNINELHCHFLEATAIHLFFKRGPPGGAAGAGGVKPADTAMGGMDDYAAAQNKALPGISPAAKMVYNLIRDEPQSNEGLHIQLIAAKLNLPLTDVARAGDELLSMGLILSYLGDLWYGGGFAMFVAV